MTDKAIEQEIQAKGLTAPRITPELVEANIVSEHYFTAGQGVAFHGCVFEPGKVPDFGALNLLTFCVLVLKNGFTVTGESACASPENFNAELGRNIARQNAIQKIWPLMGYELRSKLSAITLAEAASMLPDQDLMRPPFGNPNGKQAVIDYAAANGLPLMADGSLADPEKFGVI